MQSLCLSLLQRQSGGILVLSRHFLAILSPHPPYEKILEGPLCFSFCFDLPTKLVWVYEPSWFCPPIRTLVLLDGMECDYIIGAKHLKAGCGGVCL